MVRLFQVAGLPFSLDLPDAFPAADLLHNYDPFEIPGQVGDDNTLFRLTLTDKRPDGPREVLFHAKEEAGEPVVGFFRQGDGFLVEFAPVPGAPVCGVLRMSGDFRRGKLFAEGVPADQAFAVNNALMLLYAFASAPFPTLEMHASAVVHGGRGFLFLGRSGTGKSTHSRLWHEYIPGTDLMNDDNPIVRYEDGRFLVYGSPWSGKTSCYRNVVAPVNALVQQVPCFELECLPDAAAARLCHETVDG